MPIFIPDPSAVQESHNRSPTSMLRTSEEAARMLVDELFPSLGTRARRKMHRGSCQGPVFLACRPLFIPAIPSMFHVEGAMLRTSRILNSDSCGHY